MCVCVCVCVCVFNWSYGLGSMYGRGVRSIQYCDYFIIIMFEVGAWWKLQVTLYCHTLPCCSPVITSSLPKVVQYSFSNSARRITILN